jgi:hypothetical protein
MADEAVYRKMALSALDGSEFLQLERKIARRTMNPVRFNIEAKLKTKTQNQRQISISKPIFAAR